MRRKTVLARIGRLFVIKTRWEAYVIIYALAVGAIQRGMHYLTDWPGLGGKLLFLACTGSVFLAGAKILDCLKYEKAEADRRYNEALTALDGTVPATPELPVGPQAYDESRLPALNEAWNILPSGAPAAGRSLKGRLRGFIWRLVGPSLEERGELVAARERIRVQPHTAQPPERASDLDRGVEAGRKLDRRRGRACGPALGGYFPFHVLPPRKRVDEWGRAVRTRIP